MKDRIRDLMLDKGMSQKNFASELCIAEATLSGIFNGRTRPTTLTVNAIHERFPDVNISWLMFGDGDMYVASPGANMERDADTDSQDSQDSQQDLFSTPSVTGMQHPIASPSGVQHPITPSTGGVHHPTTPSTGVHHSSYIPSSGNPGRESVVPPPQIQYIEKYIDKPQRKITEIRIFFDDGTYETFTP